MTHKKNIHKGNGRPCPECGETIYEAYRTINYNGVEHHEKFIKCQECGFEKKIKEKHYRYKLEEYFIEE